MMVRLSKNIGKWLRDNNIKISYREDRLHGSSIFDIIFVDKVHPWWSSL